MSTKAFLLFVVGWLVLSAAAHAHHSPAMFDTSKQLTLTGTVRLFHDDYANDRSEVEHGLFTIVPPAG